MCIRDSAEPGQVYAYARERMAIYVGAAGVAIRHAKEAIDRGLEVDIDTGAAIEAMLFAGVFATKDAQTGMVSFMENGPGKATFEGK